MDVARFHGSGVGLVLEVTHHPRSPVRRVESCGQEPGGTAMIDDCGETWAY